MGVWGAGFGEEVVDFAGDESVEAADDVFLGEALFGASLDVCDCWWVPAHSDDDDAVEVNALHLVADEQPSYRLALLEERTEAQFDELGPHLDVNRNAPARARANPEYEAGGFFRDALVTQSDAQGALAGAFAKVRDGQAQRIDIVLSGTRTNPAEIDQMFLTDPGFAVENWVSVERPGVLPGFRLEELTVLYEGERTVIYRSGAQG